MFSILNPKNLKSALTGHEGLAASVHSIEVMRVMLIKVCCVVVWFTCVCASIVLILCKALCRPDSLKALRNVPDTVLHGGMNYTKTEAW